MLYAAMLSLLLGANASADRLAVIQPAPDFTLTTQDDQPLRLADLRDKVVLVSFIFTTCNGSCPATTSRLLQVQTEWAKRGHQHQRQVQLLSITLDPARDTPARLKEYMKLYDVDSANWTFLTGAVDTVNRTIQDWGMWAKPAANAQLDHPSRIFLVDRQGRIREIYHLAFFKTAWVIEDIELLLHESP